jgi:predicted Ser/Thr protein kinase
MVGDDTFEIDLRTGAAREPVEPSTGSRPTRADAAPRPPRADRRFPPGTLIGGRYRVVQLVGRGGMGEVYRAEDLRLGEEVALKFLAASVAENPGRRARFISEAKVARKLTHANLCRVHDFGEADGEWFLSMEFVEGEDLSVLLKRKGRLPAEEALDVAQQLCLGLAAAHERGVLHRDLKPANVMVDVHGRVRLMDFGLAALANEIAADDALAGTPRYMAPEQLRGTEVTMKSDLYALGLVLHEIFVGRLPPPDWDTATSPESLAPDVDPAVLRVIAACLDPDPRRRPASAIVVAANMPGGDPLAAAVRAGELPSPAMVAAAATTFAVPKATAAALAACAVGAMLLVATYTMTINPFLAPSSWARPPEALVDRAKDVVKSLGLGDQPRHHASGIQVDDAYLAELRRTRSGADRWTPLRDPRPAAAAVWWRGSPRPLGTFDHAYAATPDAPPPGDGEVSARISMAGDLLGLEARPPLNLAAKRPVEQSWDDLFARAGLDRSRFAEEDPRGPPPAGSDSRRAWEGPAPEGTAAVRVEGATLGDAVVSFRVLRPWHRAGAPSSSDSVLGTIEEICLSAAFVVFLLFAFRNVRRRRVDLRAATRLGIFLAIMGTAYWLCQTDDLVGDAGLFWSLAHGVGQALFVGLFGAATYLAVEPFVRRHLPHLLVGSTRLLEGRIMDPVVGRDLLAGAAGVFLIEILVGVVFGLSALGVDVASPPRHLTEGLGLYGIKGGVAELIRCVRLGPTMAVMLAGIFAGVFALFRRRRLAFVLTVLLGGLLLAKHWVFESLGLQILFGALTAAIGMLVLVRFGVLAASVFGILAYANAEIPVTFAPDAWYARGAAAYVVAFVVLLVWGWRAATLTRTAPGSSVSSGAPAT